MDRPKVLMIGFEPTLIDFSEEQYCDHVHAPGARLCFNIGATDTAKAVERSAAAP